LSPDFIGRKTEELSSSLRESMREERRPQLLDADEAELRRDAEVKLAIRPNALMAFPVFYFVIRKTKWYHAQFHHAIIK
jgi:hypothetical protein